MLLLAVIANIIAVSHQASVFDNLTANIAVVEYQPSEEENLAGLKFLTNILAYTGELDLLKNEKLDMIIFPESTLQNDRDTAVDVEVNATWSLIPDNINPLNIFSYLAATHNTYLVINLLEREKCEKDDKTKNCKDYGFHFYNTDVIFDRNGTVINKYRKYNLFGEFGKDKPDTAEQVVIKTDFGANFGIFTCFDILFKSPAQDLLSQNIDAVIFPTMWFSELPFLTAVQTQQMWAQAHDATLFSAGANDPAVGSGGTGVFRGSKGAVMGGIIAEGGTKTFLYKSVQGEVVPQQPENVDTLAKNMDNFYLKRDISLDDFVSRVLETSDTEIRICAQNATENQLCCDFNLTMSQNKPKPGFNYYTYHLVVFSGVRSFDGVYNGGIQTCGIIACLNSSLSSCGRRFPKYEEVDWPVTFEEITISANFEKSENKTQFPNSLLSSILPIDASQTVWSSEEVEEDGETFIKRTWSTTEKQDRLLTFAIFGRNFELDFAPPSDDDSDDGEDNGIDNGNGDKVPGSANGIWGVSFWLLLSCSILLY